MNILMLTNTFTPHVGGVARSVESFAREYRARGHRVVIVAPEFDNLPADEVDVIRVPAIQNFNGSDFSVRLPLPGYVSAALEDFKPDIVHSHHPFLLGDNAMRIAASWNVPLVFTHHTMYEQYTHYVPGDSPVFARFIIDLTTSYCNLCDRVFAPSESVVSVIRQRGVIVPIDVVPTGVDVEHFANGDGRQLRRSLGIPDDAFVVGHLGRLAPEKNLEFLADSVSLMLKKHRTAHFLVVGSGPSEEAIQDIFRRRKLSSRLHMPGSKSGQELVDAYHAMDVFAFASQSETQGMVLTEAMAAGVPVVAVDASGAREVVVDRKNGRLLPSQDRRTFAAALASIAAATPEQRNAIGQKARETAEQFSMANCAEKALHAYKTVMASERRARNPEDGTLESIGRLIGMQWELLSNVARAAGTALQGRHLWKTPVLGPLLRRWQHFRRRLSRSEWGASILGLSKSEGTATEPGLILIQIDGFSRTQLERALRRRRMPFLRKLMAREHYEAHTMYPGVPTTTPAVQGELFYGVRQIVPAFSFRDRETCETVWMLDPDEAARVQRRLGSQGHGLLEGGSAYSNIYTGGAKEPHFCASVMGWGDLLRGANPLAVVLFAMSNIGSFIRSFALALLELFIGLADSIGGIFSGRHAFKELKFIPARIGVCILLRDLITIGACMDAARGLPIVQVNFLGYDEQAHHRGPGSNFAHWTLKGIDRCIRRIWKAAQRSNRRDYQIWIYSDHGQEHTIPYYYETGQYVEDAVAAVLDTHVVRVPPQQRASRGVATQRANWLGGGKAQRLLPKEKASARVAVGDEVAVTALGPLGLVYPTRQYHGEERKSVAHRFVTEAKIPLALTTDEQGQCWAYTPEGEFRFPDDARQVLGQDHPFAEQAARDLCALCDHPDGGGFVICGWRKKGLPLTFVFEHGAHAGPGPEETRAFALLPPDAPIAHREGDYILPGDLRMAALHLLGRSPRVTAVRPSRKRKQTDTVRILTYNVHTCIGMDGKLSPARIARVIAQCDPDIVALQELDVRRVRTGAVDQAHEIARELQMEFHFYPSIRLEEEQYGDAILSRYPMRLVRNGELPGMDGRPHLEPRGAIWVAVEIDGQELQLVNTHLGLLARERLAQVEALLGPEWLGHPDCKEPVVLCGDFNAMPGSQVYRRVLSRMRDAQLCMNGQKPKKTFFSRYPIGRIDHVFVAGGVEVINVEVPRSQLIRTASDHLPLVTEIRLR